MSKYTSIVFAAVFCGCVVEMAEPKGKADNQPSESTKPGPEMKECAKEAKYQCQYECIKTATPPNRNQCEVDCNKRPLSHWDGKIPACTQSNHSI